MQVSLRNALLGSSPARLATESFTSALHELVPFLSDKPKLTKDHTKDSGWERYIKDLRSNIETTYGNEEWLSGRDFTKDAIKFSDVAALFCREGKMHGFVLTEAEKGGKDILGWVVNFSKILEARMKYNDKVLKEIKNAGIEKIISVLSSRIDDAPSPLASVGNDIAKLPGCYELVRPRQKDNLKSYSLYTDRADSSSKISPLGKEGIKKCVKVIYALLEDTEKAYAAYDGALTLYNPFFQDSVNVDQEELDNLAPHQTKLCSAFSGEGMFDMEGAVCSKLIAHIALMCGGLENLMHRSLA